MSSLSRVEVVEIEKVEKHPNADALDIVWVSGFPSIVKRDQFKEKDLAGFVAPDMVIDLSQPEFQFLSPKSRVRSIKLRGILSYGLVFPIREGWILGQDVTEKMGCKPYEAPEQMEHGTNCAKSPKEGICYTDIESARKYADKVFEAGEVVVITEKIHGENFRAFINDEGFQLGSRHRWKEHNGLSKWSVLAKQYDMEEKLKELPYHILFGESYGFVQDLRYGHGPQELSFAAFDLFDIKAGRYLDYDEFSAKIKMLDIPSAPILYRGPYISIEEHGKLGELDSVVSKVPQLAEGIVIRPQTERYDHKLGRVVVKLHSERYLTRK